MKLFISNRIIVIFLTSWGYAVSGYAGMWQPICPEHVGCSNGNIAFLVAKTGIDAIPESAPLITRAGKLWFSYANSFDYLNNPLKTSDQRNTFRLHLPDLTLDAFDRDHFATLPGGSLPSINSIQAENDEILAFSPGFVSRYSKNGEYLDEIGLNNKPRSEHTNLWALQNTIFIGSPIIANNTIYIGLSTSTGSIFSHSTDNGKTWRGVKPLQGSYPEYPYRLASNLATDELWVLASNNPVFGGHSFAFAESSLWRSKDHGETWSQVDDGSFPDRAGQVVGNASAGSELYALTAEGLYLSETGGRSWTPTALKTAVYSLEIIPQADQSAWLVAGVEQGVVYSKDRGNSWQPMSAGLLPIPHSLQYAQGTLVASSAAGYFVCSGLDCVGEPLAGSVVNGVVPNDTDTAHPPTLTAIEFYNRTLDHYFLTVDAAEAMGIDEGKAGAGWMRTGHSFKVWPRLGAPTGAHVCRFYGSVDLGPNSHFFSISPAECSQLLELQASIPEGKPRWHLEDYPFMAVPKQADGTCPDTYQPVYRAYNNGFKLGKDSNHRYVTNRALLEPLFAKGWADEGIGFCVPE